MVQSLWKTVCVFLGSETHAIRNSKPLLRTPLLFYLECKNGFVPLGLLFGDARFVLLSFICFSISPHITRLHVYSDLFLFSFLMISMLLIAKLSLQLSLHSQTTFYSSCYSYLFCKMCIIVIVCTPYHSWTHSL